jgi:hypothetical protein
MNMMNLMATMVMARDYENVEREEQTRAGLMAAFLPPGVGLIVAKRALEDAEESGAISKQMALEDPRLDSAEPPTVANAQALWQEFQNRIDAITEEAKTAASASKAAQENSAKSLKLAYESKKQLETMAADVNSRLENLAGIIGELRSALQQASLKQKS